MGLVKNFANLCLHFVLSSGGTVKNLLDNWLYRSLLQLRLQSYLLVIVVELKPV